ncbi:YbjN domain-containing protein [Corynebacterium sp. H127]|uniref:YbjN domain-containing protein n=1 Tax=Corynebacterium sp. H127 TaxID=3133418 RepID=UPI00309B454B
MNDVTLPRLLETMTNLNVQLAPTKTPGLWAANLNGQLFQFALMPSQAIVRADLPGAVSLLRCNEINASGLLVSAAVVADMVRIEHTFPTAAGLADAQLKTLLSQAIDHIFAAIRTLQP